MILNKQKVESREIRELCRNCRDSESNSIIKPDTLLKSSEQKCPFFIEPFVKRQEGKMYDRTELQSSAVLETSPDRFLFAHPVTAEIPYAERIDLLPQDELSRARAKKFIGQVALNEYYIEPSEDEAPNTNLLIAINRAYGGNKQARLSVETNVRIAVAEALIKTGHISTVGMEINENGYWLQFGQSMMHVHANALKTEKTYLHSGLVARAKAETLNGQRIEDLSRQGELDDHYIFVASLVPSSNEVPLDVSTEKAGFFGETMTAALQLTGKNGNRGKLESAFVAGVVDNNAPRHDLKVLKKIYELAGYEVEGWQPLDFLSNPLKIHKSNLPNGIADIVELYDKLASEVTNQPIFFGQNTPGREYSNFAEYSVEREHKLKNLTDSIIKDLYKSREKLKTPEDAINQLAEIIRVKTVPYAVRDQSINPNVFGTAAAKLLVEARMHYIQGQNILMDQKLNAAIENAIISVCGGTVGKINILDEAQVETTGSMSDDEDCEFVSKQCPMCGTKNVKTVVSKHTIRGDCGCEVKKD